MKRASPLYSVTKNRRVYFGIRTNRVREMCLPVYFILICCLGNADRVIFVVDRFRLFEIRQMIYGTTKDFDYTF